MFKRFRKSEKGQGMVEYGLILALVSIVALGALGGIGDGIKGNFEKVTDAIGGNVPVQEEVGRYTDTEIEDLVNEGYIKVATAEDLNNVRNDLGGKYIQVKDIDLKSIANFEPIGKLFSEFKGSFDGGGYTISNLKIDRGTTDNVGLFGRASGATLKNIGLEDVNVTGTGNYTGGLVGLQQSSSIENSYVTGSVTGSVYNTGGLVGYQYNSSIENSYATGSVTTGSGNSVGGLVGYQDDSSIENSYATGSVTGSVYNTGGLVGFQDNSSITNSYATGTVNGTGDNTGGLVGHQRNSSTVKNSYATGNVTGVYNTGGLVGEQDSSSTVTNSYATGSVTGTGDNTGGLVGYQNSSSTVSNSYAKGAVTGEDYTGGLVGRQENSSTVTNSYATGSVTGGNNTGGLVGYQTNSSTTNSYWDKETTGQSLSAGGTGKSTVEMKEKGTYEGWDFESIWTIESNQYPTHR